MADEHGRRELKAEEPEGKGPVQAEGASPMPTTEEGPRPPEVNRAGALSRAALPLGAGVFLDLATGGLSLDPDMYLPSRGMDVELRFYYNSDDPYNVNFGYARTMSLNRFLEIDTPSANKVTVHLGTGRRDVYSLTSGIYKPAPGAYDTLTKTDSTWGLRRARDQVYFAYDAAGRLSYIKDLNGNTHTIARDGSNRISSLMDGAGRLVTFTYDGNRLNKVLDWAGRYQYFSYDGAGNLTKVIGPTLCVTSYGYDGSHRLTTIIDPDGYVFTYEYDSSSGRVTGYVRPGGERSVFTYPSTGLTAKIDALGQVTYYHYDANRDITSLTDASGNTTTYTYGTWRELQKVKDAEGRVTTYTVDIGVGRGLVTAVFDPRGGITYYDYNSQNRMTKWTDPLHRVTTYHYDARGNLDYVIDRTGSMTTYTYDGYGNRTSMIDPFGRTTTYDYDSNGNLIAVGDPLRHTTTFDYDPAGNVKLRTNALGKTTYYEYDNMARLTKITDPDNNITQYAYDGRGNRTLEVDAKGNRTTYQYDGNSRLVQMIDALGQTTTYDYDQEGRQIRIVDAENNATFFDYDAVGRQTGMRDEADRRVRRSYSKTGNLRRRVASRG